MTTATVSTVEELRAAVADPAVNKVVMMPGTYVIDTPMKAHSGLLIDAQGSTIVPPTSPAPGTFDPRTCPTCHRVIVKEAHGGEHPSAGDHDPAFHVRAAYGTKDD